MTQLILASKSPRRIEILKKNGIKFKVLPAEIDENTSYRKPHLMVKELAYKKALSVALRHPDSPVLAADTIVWCNGKVIGKPRNKKESYKMLKFQSGKWQSVYTGVALIYINKKIFLCDYEKTRCYMRKLSEKELKNIAGKHLDKAGGWAVQDENDLLITKIKGRYDNVVGLPMNLVKKFLSRIK